MAGVKISELTKYNEEFPDNDLEVDISHMIIPVTFGRKTFSITLKEFIDMNNTSLVNNEEFMVKLANKLLESIKENNGEGNYDDEENENEKPSN